MQPWARRAPVLVPWGLILFWEVVVMTWAAPEKTARAFNRGQTRRVGRIRHAGPATTTTA